MSALTRDTIFALSSGRGPAAIAVIRISGARAGDALTALTGKAPPAPRQAALARVRDPGSNEIIDEGLALFFPGPRSETGEDVVELQLHGGRAVVAATLSALGRIEGLRPAEAGEFTRRAFENGKLDLTAVEGLADLVSAETEGQRRQAFRQMKGALGGRAEGWRQTLIRALALVEAGIDFSDEADVPEDLVAPALDMARGLAAEIETALADQHRGERLREGMVVAIAGPPNAGKSTLLNRIARREAAIVSPYAGTTRDVIEVHLDLHGWPVTLLDTAGIRDSADPVEMEGVRRARERAAGADLVLWVTDAREEETDAGWGEARAGEAGQAGAPAVRPGWSERTDAGGTAGADAAGGTGPGAGGVKRVGGGRASGAEARLADGAGPAEGDSPRFWRVLNKIDLVTRDDVAAGVGRNESEISGAGRNEYGDEVNDGLKPLVNKKVARKNESIINSIEDRFKISASTGAGVDGLIGALANLAGALLAGAESALVTRERHRVALRQALDALRRALAPELAGREDLLAEELRLAAQALGRLTGRVDVEDILDVIFRDFCIGK